MRKIQDTSLADTGERMIPAHHKGKMVYGEHIVRYEAVLPLVKDKAVLDIACGSGYGSALIGQAAKQVIGVDVDQETVSYATKNYSAPHVSFRIGDGVAIPLEDASVDVVVTFETIEHIKDYRTFMKEVKRVLKKDGLLVLSTPNDIEFIEGNHFHIHEFEEKELASLVAKYFSHTKSYFQATWLYNALLPREQLKREWRSAIETIQTAPIATTKAIYFYMLCSNREISGEITPIAAISQHYSERQVHDSQGGLQAQVQELSAQLLAARQEAATNELRVRDTMHQLKLVQAELDTIKRSRAWKTLRAVSGIGRHGNQKSKS